MRARLTVGLVVVLIMASCMAACADESGWDGFSSGIGAKAFVAAGVALPLLTDGKDGSQETFRTVDALIVSAALSSGLKRVVGENRPDDSSDLSFPSSHATLAFAVAAMQSEFHPKQAPYWYAGASAIAVSRVTLGRHYWHDVAAGAALGYLTAKWELSRPRGLVLTPLIAPTPGVQLTMSF